MSSKNKHIYEQEFRSWGEALDSYLKHKELKKVWLAKELIKNNPDVTEENYKDKVQSKQSEISRWVRGKTPIDRTIDEINDLLNISIVQNEEGLWTIIPEPPLGSMTPEQKISLYKTRPKSEGFSHTERDLILESLADHAESLAKGLRRLLDIERSRE